MSSPAPRLTIADEREANVLCPRCSQEIRRGESIAICVECGSVHHRPCWEVAGACCAYACLGPTASADASQGELLTVTRAELSEAQPLASPGDNGPVERRAEAPSRSKTWNRTAWWALAVAILGIPAFGLVTGLVAIVLAVIALVAHTHRRRGMGIAVAALLLGVLDVVGWTIGLAYYYGDPRTGVALQEMVLDPEALEDLPDHLARALRANVVIQVDGGVGRRGLGSGIVLTVEDGLAKIVTNRHVVDLGFTESDRAAPGKLADLDAVSVMSVGQNWAPGVVEWIAPHGVDLAIVSAPLQDGEVRTAIWERTDATHIGESVFAVGNPHGLGWTHSEGSLSQVRTRRRGGYRFKILQSTAAINPGSSGGGLYDLQGRLIGINTLTGDKRFAEGLGFAISFDTVLELVPDWLHLPAEQTAGFDAIPQGDDVGEELP